MRVPRASAPCAGRNEAPRLPRFETAGANPRPPARPKNPMSNADLKTPAGDEPLDPKAQRGHEDDVIIAPRGSKRGRFLMTFLLVILVLTTFSVSDQVLNVF